MHGEIILTFTGPFASKQKTGSNCVALFKMMQRYMKLLRATKLHMIALEIHKYENLKQKIPKVKM